jgi:hypothetical protein
MRARRAALIKFREKYVEYAKKITPPSNVHFTIEVSPWVAAPEGTRGVDDALATFQRGSHTSTREINFALGGMMSVDNNYGEIGRGANAGKLKRRDSSISPFTIT